MKIHGGHDYYDSCLAYGSDEQVHLVRYKDRMISTKEIAVSSPSIEICFKGNYTRYGQLSIQGKWYHIQNVWVIVADKMYCGVKINSDYFWSEKQLQKHLDEIQGKDKVVARVIKPWFDRSKKDLQKDFFEPRVVHKSVSDYLKNNRIAILSNDVSDNRLWDSSAEEKYKVNPYNLGSMGFAKALDPFTMMQELSMWIGGVLGGNSPQTISIVDDKVLAESHGYDKHSFRSSKRT